MPQLTLIEAVNLALREELEAATRSELDAGLTGNRDLLLLYNQIGIAALIDSRDPAKARSYFQRSVEGFEALLKQDPDIDRWSFYIGSGAVRFYLPMDVQLANDFFAQAVVVTEAQEIMTTVAILAWVTSGP